MSSWNFKHYFVVATLVSSIAIAQDHSWGPKQVFDLGATGEIAAAPSSTIIYIAYSEEGTGSFAGFFLLDTGKEQWKKLPSILIHGRNFWPVRWGRYESNEVLLVPEWQKKAIVFKDNKASVEPISVHPLPVEILEPETGRLTSPPSLWVDQEKRQSLVERLLGRMGDNLAPEVRGVMEAKLKGPGALTITDISPDGYSVLFDDASGQDYKGVVTSINLQTGKFIEFAIHDRIASIEGARARFSPDGQHVLISFRYTPEHVSATVPGYLQLFTAAGQFVEELSAYDDGGFWNQGDFVWLHNNWIVYTTPSKIVFRKFLGEPSERAGSAE